MMYTVYILYSETLKRYYTGQTKDFENRLERHNSKKEKYTKNGTPWKLVWNTDLETRSEAVRLESKIKKRGAKRYLDDMLGV